MKSIRIVSPDGEASYHCVRENETCDIGDIQTEWGYLSPRGVFYKCRSEPHAKARLREDPRHYVDFPRTLVRRLCVYIKAQEPERFITIDGTSIPISEKSFQSLKQQLCGSA